MFGGTQARESLATTSRGESQSIFLVAYCPVD